MLVCLILSAASTDASCINSTRELHKAHLLDSVDALADASVEKIRECIRKGGIHKTRAKYLKRAFCMLRDKYSAIVPTKVDDLITLPGVGRKTAILVLNEAYGFFSGIGTDKHVCHGAEALGLFDLTFGLKRPSPLHVEASLSMWIPQHECKEINTIFGSFAQLFTQDLATVKAEHSKKKLNIVLLAILQRFHSYYELELIWFIIGKLRAHYQRKESQKRTKRSDSVEANGAADEDGSSQTTEDDDDV